MATTQQYSLAKIIQLKPREGTKEDRSITWLPVTCLDKNGKQVTVRLPYPRGEADVEHVTDEECVVCNGTGHLKKVACSACNGTGEAICTRCKGSGQVNCKPCPVCHGTGHHGPCDQCQQNGYVMVPCDDCDVDDNINCFKCDACDGTGYRGGGRGVIRVNDDGIITLEYDETTLGVNGDGKLYAKVNAFVKLKEKGGLAFDEDADGKPIYVTVDDETIKLDENGYLYVANYPHFNTQTSGTTQPIDADSQAGVVFPAITIPEGFEKAKIHVTVDIRNPNYENATDYTLFDLQFNEETVSHYTYDQTMPCAMYCFDTIVDRSDFVDGVVRVGVVALDAGDSSLVEGGLDEDEVFPIGATITWNVNAVSC